MRGHFAEIKHLSGGTFKTEPREIFASDEHGMAWIEASADRDVPLDLDAFDGYWGPGA